MDILNEDVSDNMEKCVWEPSVVKINALSAASEATCLILSVDETIKNPKYVHSQPSFFFYVVVNSSSFSCLVLTDRVMARLHLVVVPAEVVRFKKEKERKRPEETNRKKLCRGIVELRHRCPTCYATALLFFSACLSDGKARCLMLNKTHTQYERQ